MTSSLSEEEGQLLQIASPKEGDLNGYNASAIASTTDTISSSLNSGKIGKARVSNAARSDSG